MWPVLVFADSRERWDYLSDIVVPVDRRIRLVRATDLAALPDLADSARPVLALVGTGGVDVGLRAVAGLHERAPQLPIVAEVPAELPLVGLQARAFGAMACVKRPAALWEWQQHCRMLIEAHRYRHLLESALERLRRRTVGRGEEIARAQFHATLARADSMHDAATAAHDRRTGRYAGLIAQVLGLPADQCRHIEAGASLHDIGKIGIPDEVLRKPGQYAEQDRRVMEDHPRIGFEILGNGGSDSLRQAAEIALTHHERFDGSGYPAGLARDAIPLAGRITAVADVFDALTYSRTYRRSISPTEGLAHLEQYEGRMFDAECVQTLRARLPDIPRVKDEL